MINTRDLAAMERRVAEMTPPVLSIYVSVNPGRADDARSAPLRAKEAMKELEVPSALVEKVNRVVAEHAKGRTLAIFANAESLEVLALQVDLPVVDRATGQADARYGEPYLVPLLLAADEHQRYGVLRISGDSWRLFEVFLGEIAEITHAIKPFMPGGEDRLEQAKQRHPAYVAVRDGGGKDRVDQRVAAWTERFYKQAAHQLDQVRRERGLERLILIGPHEDTTLFEGLMPGSLRSRLVATLPAMPRADASAGQVLEHIEQTMNEVEDAEENKLLGEIEEQGVRGVEEALTALQQGRMYVLAAPWDLDREVVVSDDSGYVAMRVSGLRARTARGRDVPRIPSHQVLQRV